MRFNSGEILSRLWLRTPGRRPSAHGCSDVSAGENMNGEVQIQSRLARPVLHQSFCVHKTCDLEPAINYPTSHHHHLLLPL